MLYTTENIRRKIIIGSYLYYEYIQIKHVFLKLSKFIFNTQTT